MNNTTYKHLKIRSPASPNEYITYTLIPEWESIEGNPLKVNQEKKAIVIYPNQNINSLQEAGEHSLSIGVNTVASGRGSLAIGEHNKNFYIIDEKNIPYLFTIGNGTSTNPHNIFAVGNNFIEIGEIQLTEQNIKYLIELQEAAEGKLPEIPKDKNYITTKDGAILLTTEDDKTQDYLLGCTDETDKSIPIKLIIEKDDGIWRHESNTTKKYTLKEVYDRYTQGYTVQIYMDNTILSPVLINNNEIQCLIPSDTNFIKLVLCDNQTIQQNSIIFATKRAEEVNF